MKSVKKILGKKVYKKIWDRADDASLTICSLGDLYPNVPKGLKNCKIYNLNIEIYAVKDRKKIDKFKNQER